MSLQISSLTTEYVKTVVTSSVTLTGDTVEMAFPQEFAAPAAGDWETAGWTPGETNEARILVGGAGVDLPPGGYWCWIRVTDNPEIPVQQFDTLYVNA